MKGVLSGFAKPLVSLKLPKINKGAFYRTCRMLHAYLSAAAFIMLIFFALSGFLLNHPQWFSPSRDDAPFQSFHIPKDKLASLLEAPSPEKALSGYIRSSTTVVGAYKSADISDDEIFVRFAGVKGSTDAIIDVVSGLTEVEISTANVTSIIHDLHRGKDAGFYWKRLIDITAILIISMSIAGLILFLSLRFRLATSLKIMGTTIAVFAGLFVFLTP